MGSKGRGWREFDVGGFRILVGKAARDNDELTFRIAAPRDVWLHAAGHAGSHVVIPVPEDVDDVPRDVVQRAAELAAWYSKARNARGKVEVHVCRAGDVRKPRGAPPGQVEIRNWVGLRVYPRGPEGEGADE